LQVCDTEERRAHLLAGDRSGGWAGVRNLVRPDATTLLFAAQAPAPRLIPPGGHGFSRLAEGIGLPDYEVEALLVVLAAYVEPRYQSLYAVLQDNPNQPQPTERLLLSVLGYEPRRRRRLAASLRPSGRLVRGGLILRGADRYPPLAYPLALPHDLLDLLQGDARPVLSDARRQVWARGNGPEPCRQRWQVIHGRGDRSGFARGLCGRGESLLLVWLPADRTRADATARAAWRLGAAAGVLPVIDLEALDEPDAVQVSQSIEGLIRDIGGSAWLSYPEPLPLAATHLACGVATWSQRRQAWLGAAAQRGVVLQDGAAERLATRYRLDEQTVREVLAGSPGLDTRSLEATAQHVGHSRVRHSLRTTAERGFDDLVLRDTTRESLERLVFFVENRDRIAEQRGLQRRYQLQQGPIVLFSGRSGTGKTLAAEAVASALGRPLHTVDLARLISKYIGETEKHVDELLSQGEEASAVLFFDEADVLFSRRMEKTSNSSEHFANLMVGYLLQRIERHDGLVILATNLQYAIDEAFLRRFQFRIEFPLPEADERRRIWDLMFPPGIERGEGLDLDSVARTYKLAGGEIRNAALKAIFLAERKGSPLRQEQLQRAIALEMLELGRLSRRAADAGDAKPDRGQLLRACVEALQDVLEGYLRPRFLKEIYIVHGSPTEDLLAGKRPAVSVALFRLAGRRGNNGLRAGFVISAWSHRAEEEYELLGVVHEALACSPVDRVLGQPAEMRVHESHDFDLLHRFWSSHEHPVRASLVLDIEMG
jgi:AAA+ superfamily predicted ATPase